MRRVKLLDATAPGVTVGRHSIWAPALGIKVPFQFGGRITKYRHREDDYLPGDSLPHELAILRALASRGMAPPIGDLVWIETLITEHPGGWHADPCGAWGYEMADAHALPPGDFDLAVMRSLPIVGSDGAWGDIVKPGNIVNGYLVDVRRSAWDGLRWNGALQPLPEPPREDANALARDVHRLCQFPQGKREAAYQDFWIDGGWEIGERRIVSRASAMGFEPRPGESVLEIGCQSGGFLQLAHLAMRGEGTVLGVELDPDYVDCARRLARRANHNVCFRPLDAVRDAAALVAWVQARCPGGLDHLLICSMEKHLGHGPLFRLVDALGARRTYIETNAVAVDDGDGPPPAGPMKLWPEVEARRGRHVGDSRDRNLRRLYRIDRPDLADPPPPSSTAKPRSNP